MNNSGKSKSKKVAIFFILISILLIIGGCFLLKQNNLSNNKEEEELVNANHLLDDFNNGVITLDEYVKYNIYNLYDTSLLDNKYVLDSSPNVDDLVLKHLDQLSDETLKIYFEYYTLSNLTFKLDDSNIKPMASATTTNLDKAYLSPSGKFLIWYTDTGVSKTEFSKVEEMATKLENIINEYDRLFNTNFVLSSKIIGDKTERYKEQLKILNNGNIDENYYSTALHIYLYKFDENRNAAACYTRTDLDVIGVRYFYSGANNNGVMLSNYIEVDPNSGFDNIDGILAHELFHHYQAYIIDNPNTVYKPLSDSIIGEATAQWAAAKVSENNTRKDILNTWVDNYLDYHNKLFTSAYHKSGPISVGYALGNFLYSYEKNVGDGSNKILKSIYSNDSLKYLSDNATNTERKNTVKDLMLRNLTQDYPSNNYLPTTDKQVLVHKVSKDDFKAKVNLSAIGMDYYQLGDPEKFVYNSDYKYTINITPFDCSINAYIIKYSNSKYEIVSQYENYKNNISIKTDSYTGYDKLYLVVVNSSFKNNINYNINIDQTGEKEIKKYDLFKTDFENYKIKVTSSVMLYGMETVSYIEGVVDELHQTEYLKTTSQVFGISLDMISYVDFASGITYTKDPILGIWDKTTTGNSMVNLSVITDKFKNMNDVTEINSNQFIVKMSKDDIIGLMNQNQTLQTAEINGDIMVKVTVKDNYISKLEYDFSKLIEGVEQFSMTLELYDHNKAGNVIIPDEVKK